MRPTIGAALAVCAAIATGCAEAVPPTADPGPEVCEATGRVVDAGTVGRMLRLPDAELTEEWRRAFDWVRMHFERYWSAAVPQGIEHEHQSVVRNLEAAIPTHREALVSAATELHGACSGAAPAIASGSSCTNRGPGSDLIGCNLRGEDLVDLDLSDSLLQLADLRDADLTGTNLAEADLASSSLAGASFNNTRLDRTNLRYTDLSGALMVDAKLITASLVDVVATDAHLAGADFTSAVATRVDLSGAGLAGAVLRGTDFTGADMTDADHPSEACPLTSP